MKRTLLFVLCATLAAMMPAGRVAAQSDVVSDNHGTTYATLAAAIANPLADTINFIADSVSVAAPIVIDRDVVVNQAGHKLQSLVANPIAVGGSETVTVVWNGGSGTMATSADATTLFAVGDSAIVTVDGVNATAANFATVSSSGSLSVDRSTINVSDATGSAIVVGDEATLSIDTVNFAGGSHAVYMNDDATGTASIYTPTLVSRMNGYAEPVRANAYVTASVHRVFYRTLQAASEASPLGSIVYLARNVAASENDTIVKGIALQMNGDSIMGRLHMAHTLGSVVLTNGYVEVLSADTNNASGITIDSIDVHSNFIVNSHITSINNGRFGNIDIAGATPQTLSINGGKYAGNPRVTLREFLYSGRAFGENHDADAAQYPYKVIDGYTVTWANWDYLGSNFDTVYNQPDHKISPVFGRHGINYKDNVDLDTMFIGWYIDTTFLTPWNFPTDELVSDTTLYARYIVVDCNVTSEYTVRHLRRNLANTAFDTANIMTYRDTTGSDIVLYPALYYGYHPHKDTLMYHVVANNDTLEFFYYRDSVAVVWGAGAGYVDGNVPFHYTNDTLVFGDTIDYTAHFATREGYIFAGWDSTRVTVSYNVDTIWAKYNRNSYPVSWVMGGDTLDVYSHTTPYSATAFDSLSAWYTNDAGTGVLAVTVFVKGTDTIRWPDYPVNAGTWTVRATPVDTAYMLGNDVFTLTITPAMLTLSGVAIDSVKFYDGSRAATVKNHGVVHGMVGADLVGYNVVALYDNPTVGTGKVITATYSINGDIAQNYYFSHNNDTVCRNGAIVEAITPDSTFGDSNTGIAVEALGYCAGNGIIRYQLTSGSPDRYRLSFSDPVFADTNWQNITTPGQIVVDVPADAPAGTYSVTVVFGDSRFPGIESNAVTVSFNVNLPETYTMPLFSDVIALVDTCHCFTDIRWFHSTDGGATWTEVVEARDQYYYQEVGGLTGEYYVRATMNGIDVLTCPQTDVTTLIADEQAPAVKVSAYPNPAAEQVTVRIDGSASFSHTLQVMSVMGLNLESRTFDGNETVIDLRGLQAGNYVVSVDGVVVRVIKK